MFSELVRMAISFAKSTCVRLGVLTDPSFGVDSSPEVKYYKPVSQILYLLRIANNLTYDNPMTIIL